MTLVDLHPRIAEVIGALEAAHRELLDVVTAIPPDRRDAIAAADEWSIAQHLEHLALVDDTSGRLISKLIKQVQAGGARETESASLLRSLDQFAVWTVKRRVEAPEFVRPREGLTSSDALAKLTEARTRMIAALREASGMALATASAPHPLVGSLNVYQWALVTAHHQRRHTEQIRVVAGFDE